MRNYHYIAYHNWSDGDVTLCESKYHSINEVVDDLYGLHDDGRSFQFLKIDPFDLDIEDVTIEVVDRLSEKANRDNERGILDLEHLHPLIAEEFSSDLVLEDA